MADDGEEEEDRGTALRNKVIYERKGKELSNEAEKKVRCALILFFGFAVIAVTTARRVSLVFCLSCSYLKSNNLLARYSQLAFPLCFSCCEFQQLKGGIGGFFKKPEDAIGLYDKAAAQFKMAKEWDVRFFVCVLFVCIWDELVLFIRLLYSLWSCVHYRWLPKHISKLLKRAKSMSMFVVLLY